MKDLAASSVHRLGVLMAPRLRRHSECGGVLNPAGVLGPDGTFYLFPRLVGRDARSRIGLARVRLGAGVTCITAWPIAASESRTLCSTRSRRHSKNVSREQQWFCDI